MKKVKHIFLVKFFLLGIFYIAKAQTLNYTTVNYPTSVCNVFNNSPIRVVGGLKHYPVSGGVSYNGTSLVLQTKDGSTVTTTLGTAYAIEIPIKQGFKYNITVNAAKQSGDPVSTPTLEIGAISDLPNPNTTNPTACGSVDQNKWSGLQSNYIGVSTIDNINFQNYQTVQNYTATSNLSYLTVLAHSGSESHASTVKINNIVIVETAPIPVFTISPPKTINCGSTANETFTVSNVNGPTGTTYEWNLGTTNNGWLYQGSAAPQTFPAGNSIQLSPSPTATSLSNVMVTVKINGTNYTTLTCNITLNTTTPPMVLTPVQLDCGDAQFNVSGGVGNSFNWSASSGDILFNGSTTTATTSSPTITATGTNGQIMVSSTVCGVTKNAFAFYDPLARGPLLTIT